MTGVDRVAVACLAALLLTMPVFALVARQRPMDPDVARRPVTPLFGYWIRDWLMWVIAPLERGFVRARVSPDAFNWVGVGFGMLAGFWFARDSLSLAGWCVFLGGAADIFDGRIARARQMADARGAFLDSTLDRLAETCAFAGVAVYFAGRPFAVAATTLALGGSMLVSYTRARGEAVGVACTGGLMQRAERLVLLALAAVFDSAVARFFGAREGTLLVAVVAIIAVGSLGTTFQRMRYISRALAKNRLD